MTTMKQFRWFWAWQDEEEEIWLREMASRGWHFQSVALPGSYTFEHGEPRDDVYRLDYLTNHKDKAAYVQLFLDDGWAYLGEMNSWQYFRKAVVDGSLPEIYTDGESKARKYQRIIFLLAILLLLFGSLIWSFNETNSVFERVVGGALGAILLFYLYALGMLLRRVWQLKKKL